MQISDQYIIDNIPRHDLRAVARLITLSENRSPRARKLQAALFKSTGRAHVIGVTGSPGAGKSTLVDRLASEFKASGKRVAVLAIDPSSPFSGGAILGDRIRMDRAVEDSEIFIRSMATRGALGGLSAATMDAVQILDAAGYDVILIETVGVGQAEVDIVRTADTCIVVMVPGMGDGVQSVKAGILEIADIFVINKSDRDGADILERDLKTLLTLNEHKPGDWEPLVLRTVATAGEGSAAVVLKAGEHAAWLKTSNQGRERKFKIVRDNLLKLASESILEEIVGNQSAELDRLAHDCQEKKLDPYSAVERLLSKKSNS